MDIMNANTQVQADETSEMKAEMIRKNTKKVGYAVLTGVRYTLIAAGALLVGSMIVNAVKSDDKEVEV